MSNDGIVMPVAGGSKPLTIDGLLKLISECNGGAKVEFVGYEEFDAVELATKSADEINQRLDDKMKISPKLHEALKRTSKTASLTIK